MLREMQCSGCKRLYGIHAVIDSEVWEKIVRENEFGLCPSCIDDRCKTLGLKITCDLMLEGEAMSSVVTERVRKAGEWRSRFDEMTGLKGLPALYKEGSA